MRERGVGRTVLVVSCVVFGGEAVALAQTAAPAAVPPPQPPPAALSAAPTPPDVVMLAVGGMIRGTISEHVAGSHVVIVLVTGETRRLDAIEFTYAGPASGMATTVGDPAPAPAPPPVPTSDGVQPLVTVRGAESRLAIRSPDADVTFHVATASAVAHGPGGTAVAQGYQRICTAPCDASMPEGSYTFALSQGTGRPIAAENQVHVSGSTVLVGRYASSSGTRTVGIIVMAIGGVLGLALISQDVDNALPGTVIMLAGVGIGMALLFTSDSAVVEARPAQ